MKLADVRRVYQRTAPTYDRSFEVLINRLLFFDEEGYRAKAADALHVKEGDSVLDIGCGTGRNFSYIEKKLGPSGRIVGLDYTSGMLDIARRRVLRNSWNNVALIQGDAQRVDEILNGEQFDGVVSTFCLSIVPRWDRVIQGATKLLRENGRLVILDFKKFGGMLSLFNILFFLIACPFSAGWEDYGVDRNWKGQMEKNLMNVRFEEYYLGGVLFLTFGEKQLLRSSAF